MSSLLGGFWPYSTSKPTIMIRLYCLIQGDQEPFPIDIEKKSKISDLKKAIVREKERTRPEFQNFEPQKLQLWKIDLPVASIENFNNNFSGSSVKLEIPMAEVGKVFDGRVHGNIQVAIERPIGK